MLSNQWSVVSIGRHTLFFLYPCQSRPTNPPPGPGGRPCIQERIWQPLEHRGRPHWFQVLGRHCPIPSTFLADGGGTGLRLVGNSTRELAALQSDAGDALSVLAVFQDTVYGATADDVPCSDVEAAA